MINWDKIKTQQQKALFNINKNIEARAIVASIDRIAVSDDFIFSKLAHCIGIVSKVNLVRQQVFTKDLQGKVVEMPKISNIDSYELGRRLNDRSDGVTIKLVN